MLVSVVIHSCKFCEVCGGDCPEPLGLAASVTTTTLRLATGPEVAPYLAEVLVKI